MLVRIETDSGITGWGEGGQYGPAEPVASCVEDVLAPRLRGRDPVERLRREPGVPPHLSSRVSEHGGEPMPRFHLAQVNIGRFRAPIDSPIMEGFRKALREGVRIETRRRGVRHGEPEVPVLAEEQNAVPRRIGLHMRRKSSFVGISRPTSRVKISRASLISRLAMISAFTC